MNVAARLETATKELGVSIVASAAATAHRIVELGAFALKGKSEPQPLYALHGHQDQLGADFERAEALHAAVLQGLASGAPDLPERISAAVATRDGARYLTFYKKISGKIGNGRAIEIEGEKSPGGS